MKRTIILAALLCVLIRTLYAAGPALSTMDMTGFTGKTAGFFALCVLPLAVVDDLIVAEHPLAPQFIPPRAGDCPPDLSAQYGVVQPVKKLYAGPVQHLSARLASASLSPAFFNGTAAVAPAPPGGSFLLRYVVLLSLSNLPGNGITISKIRR